jgi:2-dehydro-3-deoxygluconokinase
MSRIVTFGEIMGRLMTPGYQRYQQAMPGMLKVTFAGAEASIAASIAYLGGDAAFVTALPKHALADACIANLRSLGVDTRHILRTDEGRLGLYFVEAGVNQRPGNVIYDREGSAISITPSKAYDWDSILHGAEWFVISGITPALSQNAAAVTRSALQAAQQRGVKVALDMNYRSKLWQWNPMLAPRELAMLTLRELLSSVDLFIGGVEDVIALLGLTDSATPEELARLLVQRFPRLQRVALTLRNGSSAMQQNFGGLLYDKEQDEIYHAPGTNMLYPIAHVVDRLGTGDAFTAGLLYALTRPELAAPVSAIQFAAAAGCLAHSIEGDFNFSTREEITSLMAGGMAGRVVR